MESDQNISPKNQSVKPNFDKDTGQLNYLVTISTYARLCDVSVSTIYARLDNPEVLQLSKKPGVEGYFINIVEYPPIKYKRGWKKGKKRKITDQSEIEKEPITDINHYVKMTIILAHDKIKEITDKSEEKQVFKKFIDERYEKIKDQVTINEFYELIKNHQ
jgi:hypothetical protein